MFDTVIDQLHYRDECYQTWVDIIFLLCMA